MSQIAKAERQVQGRVGAGAKPGYQDLVAWQKAMALVIAVYRVTSAWPREEQYGLTSQIRRAAVAIPSNLAEGHGRTGAREYAHHVSIAFGSLCDLETQMLSESNWATRAARLPRTS